MGAYIDRLEKEGIGEEAKVVGKQNYFFLRKKKSEERNFACQRVRDLWQTVLVRIRWAGV